MELLDLPLSDDEHEPPLWHIELQDGRPVVRTQSKDIASDVEQVESPTVLALDEDELTFVYIASGHARVGTTGAKAPALYYLDDDEVELLNLAPLDGGILYVIRIAELD